MIFTIVQCILLTIWVFSIWNRIIKKEVRNYFFGIGLFLLMYILIHQLKSMVVAGTSQDHFLCYLYDVTLTMIPLLAFFISFYIGKPVNYRLPKQVLSLYIPAVIICGLLVTNEYHHLIFTEVRSSVDYTIGPVYIIFVGWILGMSIALVASLYLRNQLLEKRKRVLLPSFFLLMEASYMLAIFIRTTVFAQYENVISTMPVFITIALLESCIQAGLIASNTHYRELFEATSIDMKIVDERFRTILSSISHNAYSFDAMKQAEKAPIIMSNGMRLSSADISCGHVFWQEDVSELKKRKDELEYDNEYLQGKNEALQKAYSTAKEKKQLEERNRLYTEVQKQTSEKLSLLSNDIDILDRETKPEQERKELLHICVLATYLKRRSNLFLLLESQSQLTAKDFRDCIQELAQNLKVFDISCYYSIEEMGGVSFEEIITLYDTLEEIIEGTVGTVSFYYFTVEKRENTFVINMRLSGMKAFPPLRVANIEIEQEDEDSWHIVVRVKKNETSR